MKNEKQIIDKINEIHEYRTSFKGTFRERSRLYQRALALWWVLKDEEEMRI